MNVQNYWNKVDKRGECWTWTGGLNRGYGIFRFGEKVKKASHVAFYLAKGRWPDDKLQVCHGCNNRLCVNPAHLYEGTAQDNADDRARRQRTRVAL